MKRTFVLILIAIALSGCFDNSLEIAQSQERQAQHNAQQQEAEANRARAEADAARARADERRAQSDTDRTKAMMDYAEAATNAVKDAAAQNKALILAAMLMICALAGFVVWSNQRTVEAMAAAISQQPKLLQPPQQRPMITLVPDSVQALADAAGLTPRFENGRWLLVDDLGIVKQQQKLITG